MVIDPQLFNSSSRRPTLASKPMLICVSALEPGLRLEDFCAFETLGTKIMVGAGSLLDDLRSRYPDVHFVGEKCLQSLVHYYANADVLVCPNGFQGRSVIAAQSICCGTPVAARPHPLTDNLITEHVTGEIADDLHAAVERCLCLERHMIEQIGHIIFSSQNNLISQLA